VSGFFVGQKRHNPILDSRALVLDFLTETRKKLHNSLAEHLYLQVDKNGHQYWLFKEIVNHWKNKLAMDKSNQYWTDKCRGRTRRRKLWQDWMLM
jgi:hypothetical protein